MRKQAFFLAAMFVVLLAVVLLSSVRAAELDGYSGSDATQRSEWFRSLQRPDYGGSCCDISDCRRTVAEYKDGHWEAQMPDGKWVNVPPGKVVKSPQSIDGEAYLCSAPWVVYCFVPPRPGY